MMGTEELKLVLDAFGSATDGAKSAFIWWLAVSLGIHALKFASVILGVWIGIRGVHGIISRITVHMRVRGVVQACGDWDEQSEKRFQHMVGLMNTWKDEHRRESGYVDWASIDAGRK